MIKRILLDMDGVIADFVAGVCEAHKRINPYLDKVNIGKFGIDEIWGMNASKFWSVCGEEFWACLPKTQETDELVAYLDQKFGLGKVCLLSSPSSNLGCVPGKLCWIRQHFPMFNRRFLFGPAKQFCANPEHLLIDDYEHNIEGFEAAGGKTLRVPRPWNTDHQYSGNVMNRVRYLFEELELNA